MLRFNANLFRLAFTCSSTEETRYYLKGVFVEPHPQGGVTLTATDGHRLLCIRDESGSADECAIVALGDMLKQCKPKNGERRDVVIRTNENSANLVTTAVDEKGDLTDLPIATAHNVRIDGSFPDYRLVVPQEFTREGAPHFQGQYVATFGDMAIDLARHFHGRESKHATARVDTVQILCGADKYPESMPALILFPDVEFAFGILMPCRSRGEAKRRDVPSWFRAPSAPVAQAAE